MYLLFGGEDYYPGGGWHDHVGTFESLEIAESKGKETDGNWFHIVYKDEIIANYHREPFQDDWKKVNNDTIFS